MGNRLVGAKLGVAYTTQDFALGTVFVDADGDEYMFLQADGAVTKDLLYTYDLASGQIEDQADATNYPADTKVVYLCISPVTLADNEYAFVFVGPGQATCTADATGVAAADAICYVSATAGTISSGATAALLKGVSADAAITGGATGTIKSKGRMWSEDLP